METLHELAAVVWEMEVATWRFTYVAERARRMFGYPLEEWTEPGFWQDKLLDPRDRDWCVGLCTSAAGENRNHAFLYRARTADGRTLWVQDVVRVIPDEGGQAALLRGVMLDVTDEVERRGGRPARLVLDYDDPELERLRRILAA